MTKSVMTHNEENHRGCVIVVVAPAEFARERKNHHQHNIMAVTDMVIEDWYPTSAYFSLVPEMLFTQLLQNSSRVEHQKIKWLPSVQSFAFSLPCVPTGKTTITPIASLKHFSKYPTTMQKEITEYLVNLVILDRLDRHEYRCVAPGETTNCAPIQICLFLCVQNGIQKQPKLSSRRSRKEA